MTEQARRADAFLALHDERRGDAILVLPNAWDPGSARVMQAAGARAIGTTSMGISASLGYPDVEQLPFEAMLDAVGRIVEAVELPVTADMEAGYGDTTAAVVASIDRVVERGVVGINIEDGTGDPQAPLCAPELLA